MFLLYKRLPLLFFACFFCFVAHAQELYNIRGITCTKGSNNRIAEARITNKRTNISSFSDNAGVFTVKASEGDTVEISKVGFTTVLQTVAGPANMIIFMQPVIQLDQVVIKGQSKAQELQEYQDDYRKKGVFNNGKSSTLGAIFHPIDGLYNLLGSGPKNARHFAAMSKQEIEASEDHKRYNKEVVKRITGMNDDDAEKFIHGYTPSHEDLKSWNDYELINYIKRSYEDYKKYGPPKELQQLITPPSADSISIKSKKP